VIRGLGGFPEEEQPIPLALSGSLVLSAKPVRDAMFDQLEAWGFELKPTAVEDPVRGALVLAQRAINGTNGTPSASLCFEEVDLL
jgi:hypothetical protein